MRTSYIKRLAARRPGGSPAPPLSTAAELVLGAVAGALAQIFTIPVSVIATRQQIGRSLDRPARRSPSPKGKGKAADLGAAEAGEGAGAGAQKAAREKEQEQEDAYDDSFLGVAREIIAEEGVGGLWLGIKPGLVLTVNPAITYGLFERVKSVTLLARGETDPRAKLSPWMAFTVGALSKALATVVRVSLLSLPLPVGQTMSLK